MADIFKTRADLIGRAATELGKLVSGQNLEDEDAATINALIDPLVRQLSMDSVVDIGSAEKIDPEFFIPVARLLANEAGPSFGIPKSPDITFMEEMTLRRLSATRPTFEPLKVNYF